MAHIPTDLFHIEMLQTGVRARADGALQRRLAVDAERFKVEKAAAAEVLEKRQAAGMSERGKLLAARAFGEPDDAVVAVY